MPTNVEVAREYIHAIESGATGVALARFFTPDVAITEMPNRVAPHGRVSDPISGGLESIFEIASKFR